MKDAIKCCISCILPCGALDVIRIVHTNGHVEEISGRSVVLASEIMKLYPKHVLKKPSSPSEDGVVPRIVVLSPDAELQRGKIYFLMPLPPSAAPGKARSRSSGVAARKKRREGHASHRPAQDPNVVATGVDGGLSLAENLLVSDRYLSEILSEKLSTQRDRRRGRVAVWRPHLESISETPCDA
ncbi:hypothetical protein MLD38_027574 [Melastoma candidum]|uniref:Uncharacterized protein n=1 Tax=Melastoma candidum TaxID=119954 RepID=A0ACB9P546_9MYRT|nr:hypothetical protein MLD38_027574 [Melastoma candidum]